MINNNNEIRKLSKGLLDAVRGVMEGKAGTHPKTTSEKDLAAKAPPHDKITHADVLVGRGVLKKHPTSGKLVTKTTTKKLTKEDVGMKVAGVVLAKMRAKHGEVEVEEGERIDEAMSSYDRYTSTHADAAKLHKAIGDLLTTHKKDAVAHKNHYDGKKGPNWGHVGDVDRIHSHLKNLHDMLAQQGEYRHVGESVELDEARVDGVAPGSMADDGHLCATKVFHKEWAEGTPVYSQHAEPNANGDIAWYDVMFEHGIEKMVPTDDMEILMAESHERHSKRKMKEEVEDLEELSKNTVRGYYNKAGEQGRKIMGKMAMGGGDWSKDEQDTKTLAKREAGRKMALKRRSGEIKMSEEAEDLDELSKDAMLKYLSANKKDDAKARETGNFDKMTKRMRGTDVAVRKYTAKPGSKYVRVPATESLEIEEARGRPRKNPIPAGQSEEPEPRQHIMQQLQRAKLSMRGGEHVTFKDGTKHHVAGDHAAKILAKYSGMRPAQKEEFQKKIGSSHSAFKEEL